MRALRFAIAALLAVLCAFAASAHFGPRPVSLQGVPIPEVPGLTQGPDPIVVDEAKAIALGKAFFWDVNIGSDGVACASCHFHAGADVRLRNQLAPSGQDAVPPSSDFESTPNGPARGPNHILGAGDFPFHQTSDPLNPVAPVIYSSDNVVSSAGSFGGSFGTVASVGANDDCEREPSALFHVNGVGTRSVVARNAPTVINAVFSFRQFWDGAANNVFNGSSPWGRRDADAGVWVETSPGIVEKQMLDLVNSSLASQAVAPPVDPAEMSCASRSLADVARKIVDRPPLESQRVHWQDSVLGPIALSSPGHLERGLATTYRSMIMEAFAPRFWSHLETGPFGQPSGDDPTPYSQLEANFPLFFGLAVQLYESTLVSDESPFDLSATDADGVPIDLSPSAQTGFDVFRTAHCNLCHIGPAFTSAAVVPNALLVAQDPQAFGNETFAVSTSENVITRQSILGGVAFIDTGFASNGVTPDAADPGLGGFDPFGNPLSFADQYLRLLSGDHAGVVDPYVEDVRACDLDVPIARDEPGSHSVFFTQLDGVMPQPQDTTNCFLAEGAFVPTALAAQTELASHSNTRMLSAAINSFKIPTLRNVELTGPFMHNGGMATLEEVIEFYTRGGNYETPGKHFGTVFPQVELRFDSTQRQALLDFLLSLTDDRVRFERAPFDHPELLIPNGHVGDATTVEAGHPLDPSLARDAILRIPAVGANGRAEPLQAFAHRFVPEPSLRLAIFVAVGALSLFARERRASGSARPRTSKAPVAE